jgi:hypothetical protein
MATAIKTENDGRQWYVITGVDYGTEYEFDNAIYGVTEDDFILNEDGCPLTDGDRETIAVRNSIGI